MVQLENSHFFQPATR